MRYLADHPSNLELAIGTTEFLSRSTLGSITRSVSPYSGLTTLRLKDSAGTLIWEANDDPESSLHFSLVQDTALTPFASLNDIDDVLSARGTVLPSFHLVEWYEGLSVKPSNALLEALNALVEGMESDGDLAEHDFMQILAGLETEEQRLKPLINTAGIDTEIYGTGPSPARFDINGFKAAAGASAKGLRTKWKPITNGVKFQPANNSIWCCYHDRADGNNFLPCGASAAGNAGGLYLNTTLNSLGARIGSSQPIAVGVNAGEERIFQGAKRTGSSARAYTNGALGTPVTLTTNGPIADIYFRIAGAGIADTGNNYQPTLSTMRASGLGSDLVDLDRVRARFNTFWIKRGLLTT